MMWRVTYISILGSYKVDGFFYINYYFNNIINVVLGTDKILFIYFYI